MALFTDFERDPDARIGVMWSDFTTAVAMLVYTNGSSHVDVAALAFNTTPALVREAAEQHPWLFVHADGTIESDGE